MNQIDLNHRCAVVTGAAQGIGLSIARRLLASGATVSQWNRDADLLVATVGQIGKSKMVSHEIVDVSEPESVAAAARITTQKQAEAMRPTHSELPGTTMGRKPMRFGISRAHVLSTR